jgi:hypothetical protein
VLENGKKVLYLQLLKALSGCVQSALLWYKLFSGTLKEMGFELNPYDPCIANKIIEGTQCTIAWYVDDNKISHAKESVVMEIINAIEKRFGKMIVVRRQQHVFLGMDICFLGDGTLTIGMKGTLKMLSLSLVRTCRFLQQLLRDEVYSRSMILLCCWRRVRQNCTIKWWLSCFTCCIKVDPRMTY